MVVENRFESRFEYINRIGYNVMKLDESQLEPFYEDLKNVGVVLTCAEGRSRYKLNMICGEMAKMRNSKIVMDRRDTGFPGRNMMEALPVLIDRYRSVLLLINSGSGESKLPKTAAEQLKKYKEENKNDDVRIGLITSNPVSTIGRIAEQYGNVVKLKGLEGAKESNYEEKRQASGFMGDLFELGSAETLYIICELLSRGQSISRFYDLHEELYPKMIEHVDKAAESEEFNFLVTEASKRNDLMFAGLGSGHDAARTINVRMGHIKHPVGDNSYVAGESGTPRARPGDILVPILENDEETDQTISEWCIDHKRTGGQVMSIAESKDLETVKFSDYSIVLEQNTAEGTPNRFFIEATFVLSPLPLLLVQKFDEIGLPISESVMRYYHAVTG